jgi:hypothetical protein
MLKHIYIILILEEIIFISKGQVQCIHVEAPSLETSKLCLYFSGTCIPINPKLSPWNFSCFQFDFSVKSIKFSTRNCKHFVYILQQLPSMRRTHTGNPTWINSISPELLPTLNLRTGMLGERDCTWVRSENRTHELRGESRLLCMTTAPSIMSSIESFVLYFKVV